MPDAIGSSTQAPPPSTQRTEPNEPAPVAPPASSEPDTDTPPTQRAQAPQEDEASQQRQPDPEETLGTQIDTQA